MIYQHTRGILPDAQKYSCRFNSLLLSREILLGIPWTVTEYNEAWLAAKKAGIISGDLNMDGDFDDEGEDEILSDERLFELLSLPLRTISIWDLGLPIVTDERGIRRVAPSGEPLDPSRYWVLERWFWKQSHFVKGDGTGRNLPDWDPIEDGSLTRANGRLRDLRVYLLGNA